MQNHPVVEVCTGCCLTVACTTRVRKTEVRTTPVRSQQCECQQCEGVNSANETRVRMSNVRMPAVRCDIGAKKVRQQCECQQCESHFFFSLILIGVGRNGKREPAKTRMRKVTCCPTRTDLFSAHLHLQHLGFNVCVYVNLCANSRGEKGMGRLWYMVLSCNTTGLEKRTGENWFRRSRIFGLLSGSHDQHTVQSLPKVKWLLRE